MNIHIEFLFDLSYLMMFELKHQELCQDGSREINLLIPLALPIVTF